VLWLFIAFQDYKKKVGFIWKKKCYLMHLILLLFHYFLNLHSKTGIIFILDLHIGKKLNNIRLFSLSNYFTKDKMGIPKWSDWYKVGKFASKLTIFFIIEIVNDYLFEKILEYNIISFDIRRNVIQYLRQRTWCC
jgi:hypothetical protein